MTNSEIVFHLYFLSFLGGLMEEMDFLDKVVNSDIKDETMDIPKETEPTKDVIVNVNEMFTNLMEPRVLLDKSVVDGFIQGETMLNFEEDFFEESESDLNSESSYELFTPQHHCELCQRPAHSSG